MINDEYTSHEEMLAWANGIMAARSPDFVIGPKDDPYLYRWFILPRNAGGNAYLHKIVRSDDDRALHDHPWDNTSYILDGGYIEHTPEGGEIWRETGSICNRKATDAHRLELIEDAQSHPKPVISLFTTGPKIREWGFYCPSGWVHWRDFTASDDKGAIGRGCGET